MWLQKSGPESLVNSSVKRESAECMRNMKCSCSTVKEDYLYQGGPGKVLWNWVSGLSMTLCKDGHTGHAKQNRQ